MLPQPQLVPVIFEGLDTFTDPRRGIPTKLDLLENGYVSTPFKIQKRSGFTSQSKNIDGGGSVSAGSRVAGYRKEQVVTDGLLLYTRDSITGALAKRSKVTSGSVSMERITGDNFATARINTAGAYASGVVFYAWQTSGIETVNWRSVDATTGAILAQGTFTGRDPAVRATGNLLFVVSYETGGTTLNVRKLDPASPTSLGAPTTIATSANLIRFAVAADTGTPQLLVAYDDSGAGTTMHVKKISTALSVSADVPFTEAAATGVQCVVWLQHNYSNGTAYLAADWGTNGTKVYDVNTSTLVMSGATAVAAASNTDALTGYFTSATRMVIRQVRGATVDLTVLSAWSQGTTFELIRGCLMSGAVFKNGTRYYLPISHEDTTTTSPQRHRYLLEYEHATNGANGGTAIVGYLSAKDDGGADAGGGAGAQKHMPPEAISYGGGAFGLPWHYTFDQGVSYGVCAPKVTFSDAGVGPPVQFADVLFVPGLQLNVYDGAAAVEHGFFAKPKIPALVGAGGGSKAGTNYFVRLVFRWTDSRGRIWRSEMGPPQSINLGANTSISVTANTLRITNKDPKFNVSTVNKVVIEAYCTTNADATTFYLDNVTANDVTADTVTISLTRSDASLATRELLYQQGGVLANETPPAVRLVSSYQNRLFGCAYDGDIWHSKDLAEGEGAGFSSRFRIPLDTSAGIITALMDMDQSFMMGQRNGIYLLGGGDPTDTGTNLYSSPTRINTAIGPVDQVSVVRLPNGVAYNSPRGIHLMSRGLDSQYIGDKVQRYTLADTITGAVALDSRNHAVWTTSGGDLLVYDYVIGQWAVWTGLAAVSCALYQNTLALLASDGTVKVEAPGVFVDDASNIVMKLRTSWLALAGFAGYQRLWDTLLVGENRGAHSLQVSFAYNGSTLVNETLTANAGGATYNTTIEGSYTWEATPKQQLCSSVQLTIQDAAQGGPTTEGFYLSGIALVIGALGGGARLPASRSLA